MLDNHIGYIALHGFSNPSRPSSTTASPDCSTRAPTSFVFDLRDNPGGYIDAANKIAVRVHQERPGLHAGVGRGRREALGGDRRRPGHRSEDPGGRAGQQRLRLRLGDRLARRSRSVGARRSSAQHTYGKNTVQLWDPLDNGGGVRITISRWFTPDHNSVAPDGVQPDIVVNVPDGTPPDQDLVPGAGRAVPDRSRLGEDGSQPPASSADPSPPAWFPPPRRSATTPLARRSRRSDQPAIARAAMGC